MKNKITTWIAIIVVVFILWISLDAFFGLVGDIYHFLDGYIWAFFAGVIAFFMALWLVILMFYITLFTVVAIIGFLAMLVEIFTKQSDGR
jgi:hypothetical protein